MRRRTLLRLALAGAVGVPLSGCGSDARCSVLLAYFSRPGENWWNGGRRDRASQRPRAGRGRPPAITNPLASIDGYDAIVLASPIWNVRAPMIMSTFTERYDFLGTTVHPVTTHAMSGLGTTREDYARSCRGARIGAGLAVRGEQAGSARAEVDAWLRDAGLRSQRSGG